MRHVTDTEKRRLQLSRRLQRALYLLLDRMVWVHRHHSGRVLRPGAVRWRIDGYSNPGGSLDG